MSGKGFIEPHRNNLPRRKRRVVTAPVDGAAAMAPQTLSHTTLPTTEAGPTTLATSEHMTGTPMPLPPIQTNSYASSSSSVDTNMTEPPSSPRASPTPSAPPLYTSPSLSKSSSSSSSSTSTFLIFQTPPRACFHGRHLGDASLLVSGPSPPPPITPTKGHLQPTSATLPRRHRSLVLSVARKEVDGGMIRQTRVGANSRLVRNSESQSMRRRPSMCSQELAKGLTLGFLTDGDDHNKNVVRIKVYDDSTTPLSLISSLSSSGSPSPTPASSSCGVDLHSQLTLPTPHPFSHIDGTTSLTDSQIQQACTFIDEHISTIPEPSNTTTATTTTTRSGRASVLILTPRTRPEEAMSIGVSYLAGMEEIDKDEKTEGR